MQRRALEQFARLTALLHACMAVFVLVDAVPTDREKRRLLGTLVLALPIHVLRVDHPFGLHPDRIRPFVAEHRASRGVAYSTRPLRRM